MFINEPRTGRTTRMLNSVADSLQEGHKMIVVIGHSKEFCSVFLRKMLVEILDDRGLSVLEQSCNHVHTHLGMVRLVSVHEMDHRITEYCAMPVFWDHYALELMANGRHFK